MILDLEDRFCREASRQVRSTATCPIQSQNENITLCYIRCTDKTRTYEVRLAEWTKAPDLSSGSPTEIVGSNPTPDTNF